MTISEILDKKGRYVHTVEIHTSVYDAVKKLDETKAGAMLVLNEKEELEGLVSERDILYKCYNSGIPLKENEIKNLMTPSDKLIVARLDDTALYLMNVMAQKQIRHIPVLNDDEVIISIISIEDVLKAVLETSQTEAKMLREHIKNPFGVHIYKT